MFIDEMGPFFREVGGAKGGYTATGGGVTGIRHGHGCMIEKAISCLDGRDSFVPAAIWASRQEYPAIMNVQATYCMIERRPGTCYKEPGLFMPVTSCCNLCATYKEKAPTVLTVNA